MIPSPNQTRLKAKSALSGPRGSSTTREATRTDRLPLDRLVEKLHAERKQRALKDRCLVMISHELRTPLASIQLSHDLLVRYSEDATAEERQECLDNIGQQVAHLNEIVSDVLTLSRSKGANLSFEPATNDLLTLCREVVESFQLNYSGKHAFAFNCAETDLQAEFDERLLRRALMNLLGNAVKYSPDGGLIKLGLSRQRETARIRVSDQGIGIPTAEIDSLFSVFARASNVGAFPGMGLGLAVAKQALDLHGGEIRVESALGKGATFEIALPLRLARDLSGAEPQPQTRNSARIQA